MSGVSRSYLAVLYIATSSITPQQSPRSMSSDTPVETVLDVAASPQQQQGSRPQPPADALTTAEREAAGAGVATGDPGAVKTGTLYTPLIVSPSAPLPTAPHPPMSSLNSGSVSQLGVSALLKSQPPGTIVVDQRMNRDYNQGGPPPRSIAPEDYLASQTQARAPPSLGQTVYPAAPGGKGRGGVQGGTPGTPAAPVLVSTLSNGPMLGSSLQMPPQHQMVRRCSMYECLSNFHQFTCSDRSSFRLCI
jgi:hypothetical protein